MRSWREYAVSQLPFVPPTSPPSSDAAGDSASSARDLRAFIAYIDRTLAAARRYERAGFVSPHAAAWRSSLEAARNDRRRMLERMGE